MKPKNNKPYDITFIIRTVGDRPGDWWNKNKYSQLRYSQFVEGLKQYKVGFIQFKDLLNEVQQNIPAPIYTFEKKTNNFFKTPDKGVCSQVVATEVFEHVPVDFQTKKDYIHQCVDFFDRKINTGEIKYHINPLQSLTSQDKNWLLDVQRDLPHIPLSPVWQFTKKTELEEFLKNNPDKYILKARLGMAGKGTDQLTAQTLQNITDKNVHHYVIQKDISPVSCELRLVFGPDHKYLGTRVYYDRFAPWEERDKIIKEHRILSYKPKKSILENSTDIIKYANVEVGSADWLVHLPPEVRPTKHIEEEELTNLINNYGQLSLAEVNGFGTNLGPLVSPYDLNKTVVSLIAQKYLQ